MDRMAEALADLSDGNWRMQVRALLGEFLRFLAGEPAFARMCIIEVLGSGPEGLARRDAAIEAFFPIVDYIPRSQPDSEQWLAPLTPVFVTGGILEVIYWAVRRGEIATLPELEDDLTRLAFRAYRADPTLHRKKTSAPARAERGQPRAGLPPGCPHPLDRPLSRRTADQLSH